jgi:hypothetical protein
MTDWYVLLTPLAVLLVLAFYRFVGCSEPFTSPAPAPEPEPPKPYPDVVKETPDVLAYWRLSETVDAPSLPAVDEIGPPAGPHDGTYTATNGWQPNDAIHTAGAAGTYTLSQETLRDGADALTSVLFEGGFVNVQFEPALNTPQFTIEAYVRPTWAKETKPTYHAVIASHAVQAGNHFGFILHAGPDPTKEDDPQGETFWLLSVGTGGPGLGTLVGLPVSFDTRSHLVAGCDGTTMSIWIEFVDENALPTSSTTLASPYVPNNTRPMYIGAGRTEVSGSNTARFAFAGEIQDVSLYSRLLTAKEIVDHGFAGDGVVFGP